MQSCVALRRRGEGYGSELHNRLDEQLAAESRNLREFEESPGGIRTVPRCNVNGKCGMEQRREVPENGQVNGRDWLEALHGGNGVQRSGPHSV